MSSRGFAPLDFALFPKPSSLSRGASSARLSFSASCLRRSNRVGGAAAASRPILFSGRRGGFGRGIRSASNAGSGPESVATSAGSVEENPFGSCCLSGFFG
ncbi:hypothetical protein ACJRO7_033525 [Eucalyptus globulus]|uniref:Uncharacterized protein n=1 Tax=Eucalyptus globulus TaxID=34317 RepID=A0ABD3JU45_EUCGL